MNTHRHSAEEARIRRFKEASEWLVRMEDPARTQEDINEWLRWCDADAENPLTFERFQQDWQDLEVLKFHSSSRHPALVGSRRLGSEQLYRRVAVAASIAALALAATLLFRERAVPAPRQQVMAAATNRSATLPDGSRVILGAETRVGVDFTGAERNLDLSAGEAYFRVKHDRGHPFIVHAGDVEVTAVGTAFDVRRQGDETTVTVEEGVVEVSSSFGMASWRAEAGYQLTYSSQHHTATVASIDSSRALEWRSGELAYVREPLSAVIDDINRYSSRKILIQGESIAGLQFTGTVFTADVDDWLKAIQQAYPVEAKNALNGDVLLRERH
jgi:transmembrane sensor